MANSLAQSLVPGATAAAVNWSVWSDWIQVVNTSTVAVSVATDGSAATAYGAGTETIPAGASMLVPNRQAKQQKVNQAPGSTVQSAYNVFTSAGAAAANPTTISVISATGSAGTGDVTVEPR